MEVIMKEKIATLVYPIRNNQVLLAKKVKRIGVDKWNGWGGMVKPGEAIRAAAVRELEEESRLKAEPDDLEFIGLLNFTNNGENGDRVLVRVYTFRLFKWRGELKPKEDEMEHPSWFPVNELPPNEEFMPADPCFLPALLRGQRKIVWAEYGPKQAYLIGKVIVFDMAADPTLKA